MIDSALGVGCLCSVVCSEIWSLFAVLAVAAAGSAAAHEGHDHGAPASPIPTTIAPRSEASSADF